LDASKLVCIACHASGIRRPAHILCFGRDLRWIKVRQLLERFIYILHAHPAEPLADLDKSFPRIEVLKQIGLSAIDFLT